MRTKRLATRHLLNLWLIKDWKHLWGLGLLFWTDKGQFGRWFEAALQIGPLTFGLDWNK